MRELDFSRTSVRCAIKLSNASLCISLTSCCVVESTIAYSLHSFPVLWGRGCGCQCLLPTYCCLMHPRTQGFKQRLLTSHGLQLTGLRWEDLFQSFRYWVCKNGQRSVVTPLVPGVYIAFRSSLAEYRASKPCLSSFPLYWLSGAILSFLSSNVKVPPQATLSGCPQTVALFWQTVGTFRRWPYWYLEVSFDGFQSSSSFCLPSLPPDPRMCE